MRHLALSGLLAWIASAPCAAQLCVGDLYPDARVDGADLGVLLAYWGPTTNHVGSQASDLNADGMVDGTDLGTLLGSWGYCPARVTSIEPNVGLPQGGATVRILGQYLVGVTSIRFGAVAAPSFTVINDGSIDVVTPPSALGTVDVSVTGPRGTTVLPGGFTYQTVLVPPWATMLEAMPDPAVVANATLRNAIMATGRAWRVRDNATQIELVLIPPGTFTMGCSASFDFSCISDESPTRQVTLTNAFYMGRSEVTQAQWTARMGYNPSSFVGFSDSASRPVERVTWTMASNFASDVGMRLPTEAEWEYAYRAGTTTAYHAMPGYPSGTNNDFQSGQIAWQGSNAGSQTKPVRQKSANGLGLFDMSGNVWEWVRDWYGTYSSGAQTNPVGPSTGNSRVLRGGGWGSITGQVRASRRAAQLPSFFNFDLGFRVARDP
jgi:formylglycine-generating enzyme required for sulfatase activity